MFKLSDVTELKHELVFSGHEVSYDRLAARERFVRHTCADAMNACTYPGIQTDTRYPRNRIFQRTKDFIADSNRNDDDRHHEFTNGLSILQVSVESRNFGNAGRNLLNNHQLYVNELCKNHLDVQFLE